MPPRTGTRTRAQLSNLTSGVSARSSAITRAGTPRAQPWPLCGRCRSLDEAIAHGCLQPDRARVACMMSFQANVWATSAVSCGMCNPGRPTERLCLARARCCSVAKRMVARDLVARRSDGSIGFAKSCLRRDPTQQPHVSESREDSHHRPQRFGGRSICPRSDDMLELDPRFRPVRRLSGYLPLEDLGLIGDGATAALVGRDGSVPWLCVPGFDGEPLFCGLLDHAKGGHFSVTLEGLLEARQRYETNTGVLTTEVRTATGLVRITDALVLRSRADLTDDAAADLGGWCDPWLSWRALP